MKQPKNHQGQNRQVFLLFLSYIFFWRVVSTNLSEKYYVVKLDHGSPKFGMKIPKIWMSGHHLVSLFWPKKQSPDPFWSRPSCPHKNLGTLASRLYSSTSVISRTGILEKIRGWQSLEHQEFPKIPCDLEDFGALKLPH